MYNDLYNKAVRHIFVSQIYRFIMRKKTGFRKPLKPGEPPRGQRSFVKEQNTLLPYLLDLLKGQSKTSVKGLLSRGQVWVNGVVCTHFDTLLEVGNEVLISHEKGKISFNHPQLRIVWEDDHLIVVDKKPGLLSVSTSATQERTVYFLLSQYVKKVDARNKIFVLHRLDKGTSGLMMFAKSPTVQDTLRNNWAEMITSRSYVAVLEGTPSPSSDRIITYLTENKQQKVYCTDAQNGKEAITDYRVLKTNETYSLVEFDLETGRKNQIRAQMEHIQTPIAGDFKYGAQTDPAERLMLHARRLYFIHPISQEEMRFETPIPPLFTDVIRQSNKTK